MADLATLQLAGGAKVVFSTAVGEAGRLELLGQFIDAQGVARPAFVIDAAANSQGFRGAFLNFTAVELKGGGFALGYDREVWNSSGVGSGDTVVATYDANASETGRFHPFDPGFPGSKVPLQGMPQLTPLANGAFVVIAHGDLTLLNAHAAPQAHFEYGSAFSVREAEGGFAFVAREASQHQDPQGSPDPRTFHLVVGHDGTVRAKAELVNLGGTAAADTLAGGAPREMLSGGDGDDILRAGGGGDVLLGGRGRDRFEISLDGAPDEIIDFRRSEDTLQLSEEGGAPIGGTSGLLLLDARTGRLSWDRDGETGSGSSEVFAYAVGLKTLGAADFAPGFQPGIVRVINADGSRSDLRFGYGEKDFVSASADYNAAGELQTYAVNFASGNSSITWFDLSDTRDWTRVVADLDARGQAQIYATYWDDGVHVLWRFDTTGGESWSRIVDTFDPRGRLSKREVVADDGTQWAATYDLADREPWAYQIEFFDPGGGLVRRSLFNEDGSIFG